MIRPLPMRLHAGSGCLLLPLPAERPPLHPLSAAPLLRSTDTSPGPGFPHTCHGLWLLSLCVHKKGSRQSLPCNGDRHKAWECHITVTRDPGGKGADSWPAASQEPPRTLPKAQPGLHPPEAVRLPSSSRATLRTLQHHVWQQQASHRTPIHRLGTWSWWTLLLREGSPSAPSDVQMATGSTR